MCRTESLPFNGKESPICQGNDVSPPREPQTQRIRTDGAGILIICPGKGEPRCWVDPLHAHISSPFLLLPEENIMNGYGPLFLSRSYVSKIASTTGREIDTPVC